MNNRIGQIALLVDDYDKAIAYFTQTLLFTLQEDTKLSESKRWVLVAPSKEANFSLLLAKASNEAQMSRIGNQTGGRVFLFLYTDDFDSYYEHLIQEKVSIIREKTLEPWGKVAVFQDVYGNLWDLIESPKVS